MVFIGYPNCLACQRAKGWLDARRFTYVERDIEKAAPLYEEFLLWQAKNGMPAEEFFDTGSELYREMNLKEKLPAMSEEEKLRLLASHWMLVKRPVVMGHGKLLVGFEEAEWENAFYH